MDLQKCVQSHGRSTSTEPQWHPRHALLAFAMVTSVASAACGSDTRSTQITRKNKGPIELNSADGQSGRTVMVIDDGFDLDHPVFAGKIAGTYTVTCPSDEDEDEDEEEQETDWAGVSVESFKKSLLEGFKESSEPCTLTDTIRFDRWPELAEIAPDKATWNKAILSKDPADLPEEMVTEVAAALDGGERNADVHGTATAGTIAYDNPDVRLVLVQIELGDSASIKQELQCLSQAFFDLWVQAFSDPEVMDAYVRSEEDPVQAQLDEIAEDKNVSLINLSLGRLAREALEEFYVEKGCPPLDLRAYYRVQHEKDERRRAYQRKNGGSRHRALTVQSAGNDGKRVDSSEDSNECSDPDQDLLIVGSYDAQFRRSEFTNHGKCVDVYSFGDEMVVAAPSGFVNVKSGTSFSAPAVTRHLSMDFPADMSVAELRRALLEEADRRGNLPQRSWPKELAFRNERSSIDRFALRSATTQDREKAIQDLLRRDRKARALHRHLGRFASGL